MELQSTNYTVTGRGAVDVKRPNGEIETVEAGNDILDAFYDFFKNFSTSVLNNNRYFSPKVGSDNTPNDLATTNSIDTTGLSLASGNYEWATKNTPSAVVDNDLGTLTFVLEIARVIPIGDFTGTVREVGLDIIANQNESKYFANTDVKCRLVLPEDVEVTIDDQLSIRYTLTIVSPYVETTQTISADVDGVPTDIDVTTSFNGEKQFAFWMQTPYDSSSLSLQLANPDCSHTLGSNIQYVGSSTERTLDSAATIHEPDGTNPGKVEYIIDTSIGDNLVDGIAFIALETYWTPPWIFKFNPPLPKTRSNVIRLTVNRPTFLKP